MHTDLYKNNFQSPKKHISIVKLMIIGCKYNINDSQNVYLCNQKSCFFVISDAVLFKELCSRSHLRNVIFSLLIKNP